MRKRIFVLFATILGAALLGQSVLADENRNRSRAVTLWWLFFNNPDACMTNPGSAERCGEVDVFGEAYLESVAIGSPDPALISPNSDAKLGVVYATGGVTNPNGRIKLVASAYRTAADVPLSLGPNVVDPLGLGRGFENVDAEVHLVIRDHGRVVPGEALTQVTNFLDPFCSDPLLLYFSGPNLCKDVQFAVFGPTESGTDSVFAFGTSPILVPHAQAHLFRNGDMVQAVFDTRLTSPQLAE